MSEKPKNHAANPVTLRRGVGIGSGNAESDDEFLFECFVQHPAVEEAQRLTSPGMIIVGRTGSGKTAILRHIEDDKDYSVNLDPFDMAMNYVANSDTLRFLDAIGADLDLLFQVLWKHVLCIEFIRLKWSVENTARSKSIFKMIADAFGSDERRSKSLAYLKAWEGKFWITMDQNIKELTEAVERKVHAQVGGEIEKFSAGGQYDKRMSVEKKSEIVARTKNIISHDQLIELHGVIDMLSEIGDDGNKKGYYILIDRLDERWVDDRIRFRLIKALIESLRSFRKIHNLKILVALRSDVLERVVQETSDISFQREKYEDYKVSIRWSRADLRLLVETRIASMFRRKYTKGSIGYADIFPDKIGAKDSFDWMLERTLMRPRDIIAFVNECIDLSDGKPQVSVTAMRKAEVEFARKRRDALLQEWRSCFPTLDRLLATVVKSGGKQLEVADLCGEENALDDFCLAVCSESKVDHDPLHTVCQARIDGKGVDATKVAQEAASILYRTGAVGLKLSTAGKLMYSHIDSPLVSPDLIAPESRLRLHPMLHAAYNLQER